MARGGRGRSKMFSGGSGAAVAGSGTSGGIGGSGIFGMLGTTIHCQADQDSIYCNIMKFFNLIMVFIFAAFIIYAIYMIITSFTRNRKS